MIVLLLCPFSGTANGIIKKGDFTDYGAKISRADMAYVFAGAVPAQHSQHLTLSDLQIYIVKRERIRALIFVTHAFEINGEWFVRHRTLHIKIHFVLYHKRSCEIKGLNRN